MRIRPFPLLGILASLVTSIAVAATAHPKAAPAAPSRGCHLARAAGQVHRRAHAHARTHARAWSDAHGRPEYHGDMGRHWWRGEHRWPEDLSWGDERGWTEDEARWAFGHQSHWDHAGAERPWATDRFGFLTWPGKTRFVDGRPVDDRIPPPPPPPEDWQGPPPPPPPEDWQGPPPPPPDADESYEIRRF